jgi:hypothetical protein
VLAFDVGLLGTGEAWSHNLLINVKVRAISTLVDEQCTGPNFSIASLISQP